MGRKILLWILGYAWIALLAGLGLLGMAAWSAWNADHGGGMPEAAQLTAVSGTVVEGREMTVERKRRRGGKTTTHFFELDLKPDAGGDVVKLRVDHAIPRDRLEAAVDHKVRAKYNPDDDNMVFELSSGGQPLVTQADMSKILLDKAAREKENLTAAPMLGFDAALAVFGGLGVFWRRKIIANPPAA